jgi:predicted nucleic acid-binding protein
VYLDANIVVYAVSNDAKYGAACARWLARIETGALAAESSPLMMVECLHAFRNLNRILARKKRDPIDVPGSINALLSLPIRWLELTPAVVARAADQTAPVPAGDAVHLASMEIHGVAEILSADAGFDRFPSVRRRDPLTA